MCGTITFRYVPKEVSPEKYDLLNGEISKRITDEHFAYIVTTVIKNKRVLRLNILNGNTTDKDVIDTVDRLNEIALEVTKDFI